MKIVQLTKEYSKNGGVGNYLLRLCSALQAAGCEVVVIHSDALAPPLKGDLREYCVKDFDRFDVGDGGSRVKQVMAILEKEQPAMVHIQGNNNFLLERRIRDRFPVVKTLHVYDFCPSAGRYHFGSQTICQHRAGWMCLPRILYKRCMLTRRPWIWWSYFQRFREARENNQGYRKLIVASQYVRQVALREGYPHHQVEVIPYFTEIPNTIDPLPKVPTVLFVGRIYPEKGLEKLIRAFALLPAGKAHLEVVGDGPSLPKAMALARELGVASHSTFHGWQRDLPPFYRRAWALVVPSMWPEPFGIVGIEALSHARPAVAFSVGGIPEWLENGVTGFLITPYDVKEMAEKIHYLLEHPGVAQEMGLRGRTRVEQRFNKETHITRLLEIYRGVMNGRTQASNLASSHRSLHRWLLR